jgi:YtkA-like
MSKVGSAKALTFILIAANPAPPAIDDNTWTVKVLDSSGSPLSDATLSIKTWMPDHGHGSPETPMGTPNVDGTYSVEPLYLFMDGLWQITIAAQAGAVSDTATFSFCVGG